MIYINLLVIYKISWKTSSRSICFEINNISKVREKVLNASSKLNRFDVEYQIAVYKIFMKY